MRTPSWIWTEDQDEQLRYWYEKGLTWKGIAAKIGCPSWRQAASRAVRIKLTKKRIKQKGTTQFNLVVPNELLEELEPYIKASGLSRSAYVRRLMRKDLAYRKRPQNINPKV